VLQEWRKWEVFEVGMLRDMNDLLFVAQAQEPTTSPSKSKRVCAGMHELELAFACVLNKLIPAPPVLMVRLRAAGAGGLVRSGADALPASCLGRLLPPTPATPVVGPALRPRHAAPPIQPARPLPLYLSYLVIINILNHYHHHHPSLSIL